METRLLVAYALIALMAAALAYGLWWAATRERRRLRHLRHRDDVQREHWRQQREDAARQSP